MYVVSFPLSVVLYALQLDPPSVDFSHVPVALTVVSSTSNPPVTALYSRTRSVGTVPPKAVENLHANTLLVIDDCPTEGW